MLTQWILNPDVKALCLDEAKMAEFDFHQPWMSQTALTKIPRFERSRSVGKSVLTSRQRVFAPSLRCLLYCFRIERIYIRSCTLCALPTLHVNVRST